MIAPTSFFSDTGCHVRILEEAWILQEAGHKVTICTYHMGRPIEGVNIKRSLDVPWKKNVQVGSSRHKIYFDIMLGLKGLETALREKPDIIHAHLHEGAFIGWFLKLLRLGKAPLIFDFQGSMTSEMLDHHFLRQDGPFYNLALWLEKFINRLPDRIITSTHNSANILRETFEVEPDKIVTIPDRVNSRRFQPQTTPEGKAATERLKCELGIPLDRKVVVYLGLLAPYQGTDLLLQSAAQLKDEVPNAHFLIMGYPGVDSYRELANYLGLEGYVTFPGQIPYQEAARYLALGDIAVSPKMSATEGAGKITNYMAMGLPTVTFDTPVSRELLGGLGVYARYGDAQSLAENIKSLLVNDSWRETLGRQVRAKAVNEMGLHHSRHQLEEIYAQALAKYRKADLQNTGYEGKATYAADSSNLEFGETVPLVAKVKTSLED